MDGARDATLESVSQQMRREETQTNSPNALGDSFAPHLQVCRTSPRLEILVFQILQLSDMEIIVMGVGLGSEVDLRWGSIRPFIESAANLHIFQKGEDMWSTRLQTAAATKAKRTIGIGLKRLKYKTPSESGL